MGVSERPQLHRGAFLEYFRGSFRPPEAWLVGMEMEKLGRIAENGEPLPYDGDGPSVRGVLEWLLSELGGDPVYEGNHLIGIDGTWGGMSLEPGGQVEWSSRPARDLDELGDALGRYLAALDRAGATLGVRWLDVAVDPVHDVSRMVWMPKARYKIMRPYMGARGRLSHRMMTQTASIQCAYDFRSEEDWARKFRAGALLAPLAVAMFANSSRIDGRESGYRSYRQAIWRETDPDRSGVPPVVFEADFGLEAWIEHVCAVPSMFRYRSRGLVPSGGLPFSELLALEGCDALKAEDWELHLSSIFTEVRAYSYIEVRSADLVADEHILAVPTFWTGLLYHDERLREALALGAAWDDYARWREAMDSAARDGLDGRAGGQPIRGLVEQALALSAAGLDGGAACAGDPAKATRRLTRLAEHLGVGTGAPR